MARILYWTGMGLGNLIQATPAFKQIFDHDHDLDVYCGSVNHDQAQWVYPYSFVRPPLRTKDYDLTIISSYADGAPIEQNQAAKVFSMRHKFSEHSEFMYHLRLVKDALGISVPRKIEFLARCLMTNKQINPKMISLCPTGQKTQAIKKWLRFPELAQELIKRGWKVNIIAQYKDIDDQILLYKNCDMYIDKHLGEIGEVLVCSKLVIANDCGLMHYANALGVKTYGIYGPIPQKKTKPPQVTAIEKPACKYQPCYAKFHDWHKSVETGRCKHECLDNIYMEDIFNHVSEFYDA